jgi:hypothetical protein
MDPIGAESLGLWVKILYLFLYLFRFQNFYPLNNFKTCYLSVSQKGKGLANMAGGVAVPSQTRLFFLWQFSKNVVWLCHSENLFWHQTSLVKRLRTQVFRWARKLMAFNVVFSWSSSQYITPFTRQQKLCILFLDRKSYFGVGMSFCPGYSDWYLI